MYHILTRTDLIQIHFCCLLDSCFGTLKMLDFYRWIFSRNSVF